MAFEQRSPSIHLFKRVPRVFKDLGRLVLAVRFGQRFGQRFNRPPSAKP